MKQKLLHSLSPALVLVLLAGAFWILHHKLRHYQYADIKQALAAIPENRLLLSFAFTMLNYVVLTGYDVLALRYIRRPLAYRRIALASFIGYALSHNIGLSVFSGRAVRYRFYANWSLSTVQIAKVVAFCALTLWLGILAIGGIVFLLGPLLIPAPLHLPFTSLEPVGIICLALIGAYVSWGVWRKTPIAVGEWQVSVPSVTLSLCQIALSCADWALAAGVCYVLLPASASLSYAGFLGLFLLAQIPGLVSQVPGGLGVLETVLLRLLSPTLPAASVAASLVAYRLIYYLLPLSLATVLLAAHEVLRKKEGVRVAVEHTGLGIAPEQLDQMFTALYTMKAQGLGMGLEKGAPACGTGQGPHGGGTHYYPGRGFSCMLSSASVAGLCSGEDGIGFLYQGSTRPSPRGWAWGWQSATR